MTLVSDPVPNRYVLSGPDPYVPEDGTVLEPGDHLVELELLRPCAPEVMEEGLARMGWSEVLLDLSVKKPPKGQEHAPWDLDDAGGTRFRFVGRLEAPIRIRQHEQIRWLYAHRVSFDPLGDLKLTLVTHPLESGRAYEIRFLSRLRAQPTRADVSAALALMGWEAIQLTAMKKDMRLPKRPGASVTLWLGIARWAAPMSYITAEDPFYFEDVVPL